MAPFWLSREEVRELDHRAASEFGVSGIVLMENAGRGCAELLMRLNPEQKPVVILCGPGNNGGDGYVIARHLDIHGWPVSVFAVAPHSSHSTNENDREPILTIRGFHYNGLPADARTNCSIVSRSGIFQFPMSSQLPLWPGTQNALTGQLLRADCWIVDALFGTGLSRSLESPFDELVSIVNASQRPVLAVDIPSGLDCDTGEPLGPTIRAVHTASFVALKRGFLNPQSSHWTGDVHVVDIGAPRVLIEEYRRLSQTR